MKEAPKKIMKDNSVSPSTYKLENKYKGMSQYGKIMDFSISKAPKLNFIEMATKRKKYVPGVGTYHTEKADKIITLGVRRSTFK